MLAPEVKHGIKIIKKRKYENCPDLDNQESFAEENGTFGKKLFIYINILAVPHPSSLRLNVKGK
ncbi:hypothetical protein [Methanosarcina barkeri]|uniref:hypothetical protein n=1 Tax=Methanosarcina barkeri TaxID=2208 RepID=UPI001FB2B25B|nr:hypothetical protein [Methanosarcina barkeri]